MGLKLSRKLNQRIYIGNEIIVEVAWIRRGMVLLDVQAPKGVTVHREEVWKEIQKEQTQGN